MNKSKIKCKKNKSPVNSFSCHALLFISLLIFAPRANAQDEISLTWKGAINQALAENTSLASAEASLEATKANINIARGKYLPSINFLGSISESKSATFSETAGVLPASSALVGASLSQMIYNEKYLANHKIQKHLYSSQEEQYRNKRYSTISAAGQAYIGLLFADDLLGVQKDNMQITNQNLMASRDRHEVGSTNIQEVLRWETQMYANQQSVESQKATVVVSRARLNQVLNLPLETTENLEDLTIEKDGFIFSSDVVAFSVIDENKARLVRDYLVELGLSNSPVLASIDMELLAQNRQLKSDKRWAVPSFNFTAGADAKFAPRDDDSDPLYSNDKDFWKVGLSMNWPLVDGGANVNRVKQSRSQMSALELQKIDIKTSLEQAIRASVAVVISDFLNIAFASAQADAAQKNYDLVFDSYLVGESDLLDLLDAQDQKLEADISSRIALYTFFVDMLTVEQAIGYFPFLEPSADVELIVSELERKLLGGG